MKNFYDQLCNFFIRPTRQNYNLHDLGSPNISPLGIRKDFQVVSKRGYKLKCSFFQCSQYTSEHAIIYCHSFNGSRLEFMRYVQDLLQKKFCVCSFDFTGSGCSEGQYVSLGYHQKDDILAVVKYLIINFKTKIFTLWGRSMGAVSVIKFCKLLKQKQKKQSILKDVKIQSIILDSPFCSLSRLTVQIVQKKISIPSILIKAVFSLIKSTIEQKAQFKVQQLQMINDLHFINCPVLVLASKNDKLIDYSHSQQIYKNIKYGSKQLLFIRQQHNQLRSKQNIKLIYKFIQQNRIQIINQYFNNVYRSHSLRKYQPKNYNNSFLNHTKVRTQQNLYGLKDDSDQKVKQSFILTERIPQQFNSLPKQMDQNQYEIKQNKNYTKRQIISQHQSPMLLKSSVQMNHKSNKIIKNDKITHEQKKYHQYIINGTPNLKLSEQMVNHMNVISSKLKKKTNPKYQFNKVNSKIKINQQCIKSNNFIRQKSTSSKLVHISNLNIEQQSSIFQQKIGINSDFIQKKINKPKIKKNINQISHSNKCLIITSPKKNQHYL